MYWRAFFQKNNPRFTFDPRFTFGKSEVWNENLTSRLYLPHFTFLTALQYWNLREMWYEKWEMGIVKEHFLKPEIWLANRESSREMWIHFLEKCAPGQCYNISRPSLTDLTQCHIIDSLRGSRTASGNRVDPLNLGTSVSIPQIMIRKCEIYPSTWQTDSAFCKRGRNGSIIRDLAFSDRHPSSSRK